MGCRSEVGCVLSNLLFYYFVTLLWLLAVHLCYEMDADRADEGADTSVNCPCMCRHCLAWTFPGSP